VRRIAFVIIATLFALLGANVSAATPNVGQHIHVEVANHPVDGFPIARAPYTFHVTIRLHDYPAKVQYLRIDDGSTTRAKRTFSPALSGGDDVAYAFDWTVDFSSWSVGRHELRWHADSQDADPSTSGTQRQFTTSRMQVCIQSCSPNVSGRAANWHGGGSWYTSVEYVVALMLSPDTSVKPGGTIVIRSQYSGAKACAFLNPSFHDLKHGTALGCGSVGTATKSIVIPGSASVGDKLVVVALGNQEAGVLDLRLGNGTAKATSYVGVQSWWERSGLVLP
jgi:hypothetical protein